MARLNTERQEKLEPTRMQAGLLSLGKMPSVRIIDYDSTTINFMYKNEIVKYFPYSGWHSGKSIKDGRGLQNLLKQLK